MEGAAAEGAAEDGGDAEGGAGGTAEEGADELDIEGVIDVVDGSGTSLGWVPSVFKARDSHTD